MPRSVSLSARPSCCGRRVCVCVCARRAGRREAAGAEGGLRGGPGRRFARVPVRGAGSAERGLSGLWFSVSVCGQREREPACVCASPCLSVSVCPRAEQLSRPPRERGESPSSPRGGTQLRSCVFTLTICSGICTYFSLSRRVAEPSDFTSSSSFPEMLCNYFPVAPWPSRCIAGPREGMRKRRGRAAPHQGQVSAAPVQEQERFPWNIGCRQRSNIWRLDVMN